MDAEGRAEQRRMIFAGDRIGVHRRFGDRRLLRLIGPGKPPVEGEGVMGRCEGRTAVDQRRAAAEAEADALDQSGELPGIDCPAVDRGLATDGVEAGAPGPGRGERVAGECRIEAGDGARRGLEAGGEANGRWGPRVCPSTPIRMSRNPGRAKGVSSRGRDRLSAGCRQNCSQDYREIPRSRRPGSFLICLQ
jgi:hypothetical protein